MQSVARNRYLLRKTLVQQMPSKDYGEKSYLTTVCQKALGHHMKFTQGRLKYTSINPNPKKEPNQFRNSA